MGVHAPPPRLRRGAIWQGVLKFGLPFLALMCAIDLLRWAI